MDGSRIFPRGNQVNCGRPLHHPRQGQRPEATSTGNVEDMSTHMSWLSLKSTERVANSKPFKECLVRYLGDIREVNKEHESAQGLKNLREWKQNLNMYVTWLHSRIRNVFLTKINTWILRNILTVS